MKKATIIIFLIFCSCKTINNLSNDKYNQAINYLSINLTEQPFHIVDTLIYISQTNRFKERKGIENNLAQIDSLENLDKKYRFKNEYYKFNKNEKLAINNVYFSKPIGDILDVEIVNNRGNYKNKHKNLTSFGTSFMYRFKFNKKCEIEKVNVMEHIYN